ncbi:MAG TPA: hypothetical protein VN448_10880 [Gammaproteobacteria bacterium]|jgi:hypothetical protein|nr:hypothetical protein [Gammaproteobacteria bacterium]
MAIDNDTDFKAALGKLSVAQQRQLAAGFTNNVIGLCQDVRVAGAVSAAKRPDITDIELAALYQAAKSASIDSYAQCGQDTEWSAQAGHFVAKAAMACVASAADSTNLAWDAAMDARMARTCATIATGEGTANREADAQYQLLEQHQNR